MMQKISDIKRNNRMLNDFIRKLDKTTHVSA